jgi:cob(I)alamin adenosyltransferase
MGIVTKKGDKGTTVTLKGKTISKADPCLNALGTLDELTSALGLARSLSHHKTVSEAIYKLQDDLTQIGAELSCEDNIISQKNAEELETQIREIENQIKLPSSLIITGSDPASASLDLARAITRRLEREIVSLKKQNLFVYINRLSDYLFLLARQAEHLEGANKNA